jgi:hypothetical protein
MAKNPGNIERNFIDRALSSAEVDSDRYRYVAGKFPEGHYKALSRALHGNPLGMFAGVTYAEVKGRPNSYRYALEIYVPIDPNKALLEQASKYIPRSIPMNYPIAIRVQNFTDPRRSKAVVKPALLDVSPKKLVAA